MSTFYVNIVETTGDSSWYEVIDCINIYGQNLTSVIRELINDSDQDQGTTSSLSDSPPTYDELCGVPLKNYNELKMYLAKHILGLD